MRNLIKLIGAVALVALTWGLIERAPRGWGSAAVLGAFGAPVAGALTGRLKSVRLSRRPSPAVPNIRVSITSSRLTSALNATK